MAMAAMMAAAEDLGVIDARSEFDEVGARWSDQVLGRFAQHRTTVNVAGCQMQHAS